MATTSNFGWTTPDDTDLVKDGALAIRTLGNNIDTSLLDLKGGTTGQILSKNSNTDLDYTWINNDQGDITEVQAGTGISVASGTGPIPVVTNTVATAFDAKGDLVAGTGADTFSKLTVGTNGHFLTADSGQTTGLKWEAILAGTSFTPSFGGLTVGNGTNSGRYILQNKLLYVEGKFTFGSTSSVTGQITLTLPASKSFAVNNTAPIGFCRLEDTGTAFYAGNVVQNSTTAVALQRFAVTGSLIFYGSVDATNPFTWTNGDAFSYCFTCEVA